MRKIGRTRHHIRYLSCVMAAVLGLLQPCAAMAVEEESELEVSDSDNDETEDEITYITAFESLAEEDAYFSCMYKPGLEELLSVFPETLFVWTEGAESSIELEVTWESEEDFNETASEIYVFYPKWDETLYAIADSIEDTIEIPAITVEVPADSGVIIHNLEDARSGLQSISQDKSILALVYLCDEYEIKDIPSQDGETVHTVVSGQSVQIADVALDEYGAVWYQVILYRNGEEYTGYVEREYLATSDEDFAQWEETYIDLSAIPMLMTVDAGYPDVEQFPDSYQNALYSLKEKHPNWTFVRMDTGIDWNTAITKEMGDKSLVPSSSSGSWQNGVYGQGWSYASEGILKYYMDPRNFLTDPAIFQFEQLTYNSSYHTTESVQEILKNSFMSSGIPDDNQTYAQAFTAIGEKTGVSPFHLASRVLQEQGTKGTSMLISGNYPDYKGYYNYFNVGASGKTDKAVIESGLQKAKELGWNTRYKSLSGGASLIGANYILRGQDTLYLEKFNVSNGYHANFTHQYMQNIQAPNSEASNIRKAYYNAGALENSFVFKIPVFKNMPASACSKPNTTDSITLDRTTVSSLEVNKTTTLIPYVNGSKVDYTSNMTFSSDNTSVATVDSTGKVTAISPGSATISCTRSGANTAVCTVTVVKANPNVSTPTLSPFTYQEGLKLSDILLPDGWKWVEEDTEISVGTFSYEALYTPSDTVKYNTVTRDISFTVTKAIPNCKVPEKLEAQTGSVLGDITLPEGFTWESNTEIELKEPGEYTFYVSYNPDADNYYTVDHIPLIVQVTGSTSSGSTSAGSTSSGSTPSTSTGTTSSDSTSTGGTSSGSMSGSSTSTGSTSSGSTSTGSTSSGSTSTGSTSSSSTSTGSTSSGSTSTGSTSSSSTSTGSTSGSSTSTGSTSGTSTGSTSVGSTPSTSAGTTSSDNTPSTSAGTTSSSSTPSTSAGTTSSSSTPSTSAGTTSSSSTPSTSAGTTSSSSTPSTSAGSTSSSSTSSTGAGTASNNNTSGGSAPTSTASSNAASSNMPETNTSNSGAPLLTLPGSTTPAENTSGNPAAGSSTAAGQGTTVQNQGESSNDAVTTAGTEHGSTVINPPVSVVEENQAQSQEEEEVFFRPSVTIDMEDTTILTPEKLQMAKEQNFNLLLDMGNYATWSINIDSVDMNTMREVDMGITLGTENIPTELIAAILNGNKYLEFTLAHEGIFGFSPVLSIALDPVNSGRYANLFYYNPETELLEFICDTIIDINGVAEFEMEHASSYVIIVSDTSMSGVLISDDSVNHVTRWIIIGVLICMIAVVIGYGIFFYRKRMQEMGEDDGEDDEEDNEDAENEAEDDEEAEDDIEIEEIDEEAETEDDIEIEEIGVSKKKMKEPERGIQKKTVRKKLEPEEEPEKEPVRTKSLEPEVMKPKSKDVQESNEEDDWIEDEDWHEPEPKEKAPTDRFADDHAEEDWIEDEEWDIGNDWMDDAEWEKKNSHN